MDAQQHSRRDSGAVRHAMAPRAAPAGSSSSPRDAIYHHHHSIRYAPSIHFQSRSGRGGLMRFLKQLHSFHHFPAGRRASLGLARAAPLRGPTVRRREQAWVSSPSKHSYTMKNLSNGKSTFPLEFIMLYAQDHLTFTFILSFLLGRREFQIPSVFL